jgi:hypothetical protein
MDKGNLLALVKDEESTKTITIDDMLDMAKQAAAGMAYLEGKLDDGYMC